MRNYLYTAHCFAYLIIGLPADWKSCFLSRVNQADRDSSALSPSINSHRVATVPGPYNVYACTFDKRVA